jgi:hypothetical protein
LREQCCRRRGRAEEQIVIGQIIHLRRDGVGDFLAAVTDIHAPQTGECIEIFLALRIPDRRAFGALDDAAATLVQLRHIGERMDMMGRVDSAEIGQGDGRC